MKTQNQGKPANIESSSVLYCLVRRASAAGDAAQFLRVTKQGQPTFPPTKFRPGEDLYAAIVRPMEEDLGLAPESYFPEEELPVIPNSGQSPRYEGLTKQWDLYPVVVSLTQEAKARLESSPADGGSDRRFLKPTWWSLDEVLARAQEPNVLAIAAHLRETRKDLLAPPPEQPSMDALACSWAARHRGGVRFVADADVRRIIGAGSQAFNLRVADPYLAYQKQGLGFTWSFFTPKDPQDVHVHGMPAVEIYGILEGRLQLWYKPMEQRGVRAWRCRTLSARDWAEVEPLHCHFAFWLDPEGLGTVIKAAGSGELAGVGRIGVKGKTRCEDCNVKCHCLRPRDMAQLVDEYAKPYEQRDYARIAALAQSAELRTRT